MISRGSLLCIQSFSSIVAALPASGTSQVSQLHSKRREGGGDSAVRTGHSAAAAAARAAGLAAVKFAVEIVAALAAAALADTHLRRWGRQRRETLEYGRIELNAVPNRYSIPELNRFRPAYSIQELNTRFG